MIIFLSLTVLLLATIAGLVLYWITLNNGLIALRNDVDRSWANIDVLLKQRSDEIPKLVKTVEAYMGYEQATLKQVIQARNHYVSAETPHEKLAAAGEMRGALGRLFAVAESYPDLKADAQFKHFQTRITDLENQLSDRREYYNAVVTHFNTRILQIPDVWVARQLRYSAQTLFKVSEQERADIKVDIALPK